MREWKNFKIKLKTTFFLIALCLCSPVIGKIIYVDDDATIANNGINWRNAYIYLQDALADANSAEKPVEIRVAQGVYKPDEGATINSGDSSATFQLINGVAIYGGYAGVGRSDPDIRDVELFETILSGDLDGNDVDVRGPEDLSYNPDRIDNSYQVVNGNDTDETAIIDGFTITGGNAYIYTNRNGAGMVIEYGSPQISNCTFIHNSAQYFGGGIYNYYSNPTLVNCSFIQNSADDKGGGIYNYRSSPVLSNCAFSDNSAGDGGGIHSSHGSLHLTDCTFRYNSAYNGGGIDNSNSSATITNCTFKQNLAENYGGAGGAIRSYGNKENLTNCKFIENSAQDKGGGIFCRGSESNIIDCNFTENSAGYGGGGMYFQDNDPNIVNCKFTENTAHYGGAMHNTSSNPILINCKIIGNSGFSYGGGMYNVSGSLILNNCIVAANRAYTYGGGLSNNDSDLTVTNCTFTGNSAPNGNCLAFNSKSQSGRSIVGIIDSILWEDDNLIWINDRSSIVVSYSNIRGGWEGEGNIDADPLFVDADNGDYHLKSHGGRYDATNQTWVIDDVTSPCIDAGDPNSAVGDEPVPNGGRINMGAYGGTSEASKSP